MYGTLVWKTIVNNWREEFVFPSFWLLNLTICSFRLSAFTIIQKTQKRLLLWQSVNFHFFHLKVMVDGYFIWRIMPLGERKVPHRTVSSCFTLKLWNSETYRVCTLSIAETNKDTRESQNYWNNTPDKTTTKVTLWINLGKLAAECFIQYHLVLDLTTAVTQEA